MHADIADVTTQLPQNHPVDQGFQGHTQETDGEDRRGRRTLIGSTAPICTYNECRGCKTRCRAEQVPVDANDPVNSAYRYRCVCQRSELGECRRGEGPGNLSLLQPLSAPITGQLVRAGEGSSHSASPSRHPHNVTERGRPDRVWTHPSPSRAPVTAAMM
ncbi:EPIDERMAL PATTERNING FACTOR-like protein 9 [Nymphaea thermarum]|nr:EPIDERMAL PATTERNING FACTOR-like protein 9 [Nymphaea thermarum]